MLNITFETLCFAAAVFFLRKQPAGWWRSFIPFLFLTVVVETTGYILHFLNGKGDNRWLYNFYLLPELVFLFWTLYCSGRRFFRIHLLLLPGFLLFLAVYLMESLKSHWIAYSSTANLLASVVIIVVASLFFYYLMMQETQVEVTRYPAFWMVGALLVFYLGSIGCTLFDKQLIALYKSKGLPLRFIIMTVLNFILYFGWGYAFLCRYRQKISSSSSSLSR